MPEIDKNIEKMINDKIRQAVSFTAHKVTDTPTDALNVVNRKYVNLNGVTANRPISSILGQFYYDTTINKPVWWSGSTWVDATGTAA